MRRDHPLLFGLAALVARSFQLGGHSLALGATSDLAVYSKCSVPEYGQCGGIGYTGKKCCPSGWACHRTNEWYSQCRKKLDGNGCTNPEWAQCGGRDYEGETCCVKGTYCKFESEWWSYCAPKKTTTSHCKPSKTPAKTTYYPTTKPYHGYPTHTHKPTPYPTVINKPEELRLSPDWDIYAPPQEREYWFEISEMPGAIDGFNRTMLVVNGQYPGPLIEVNNGDTVVVHVKNSLPQAVTLHWHGLFQNGTQWQDGPSGVTQCPIRAGVQYTYRFPVTGELQYGTYWWHAHRRALYIDGITGPLIVHSRNDPLVRGRDFDIDQIVMLHDHYHELSEVITEGLLSPGGFNGSAIAPSPKSNVVNGRGLYNCSFAAAGRTCNQLTQSDLPELRFPPNKRVRLRFIHEGSHPPFQVSVDEHELHVIEADDTPVRALPVHRIQIATAQRYSGLLYTTGHRKGDSFYLRSQMNTDCLGLPFPDLDPQARVVIRIGDECDDLGDSLPTSVDWNDPTTGACTDLDAALLSPLVVRRAPSKANHVRVFNSSLAIPNGVFKWALNDITFENFAFDPLLQRVQRGEPIPPMRAAVVNAGLEVIDLVIQNIAGADHPFHLHNSPMFVLSSGPGVISPEEASRLQHNLTNPLRRDTITVAPGTWRVVRVITDIPGTLLFHCHIVWHQVQGLLGILLVQPERVQQLQIPQDNVNLCAGGNMSMIDPGRKRALPTGPTSYALPAASKA
ncbi:laccase, multicopper oxidase, benzenediol:oxygen oxidorectuctase [Rhodotorula mucilaginosa]|uniref:Laccase, multicopper oxidase, benzenediol:oxygen oxidorectuctase n=2 Tax=Rhodotorula mucilaginosa TaxID=5537 RepID=A0A9P6VTJ2_RHOMI|nr:laccase, multicopper oxidase, benzenediol:oxygen oxidorectuctase [Rhodotorula mucilaginosa]